MLPQTSRPLPHGANAALSAHPAPLGRVLRHDRAVGPEPSTIVPRPDLQPEIVSEPVKAGRGYTRCVPRQADIVCADAASCLCALSGHVTDAERAVMNDISRQASRLATVLAWIFALVALTSLVLLMLR